LVKGISNPKIISKKYTYFSVPELEN